MSNILLGLSYSPWTERARWALDFAEVPHRFQEYTPMLAEPWLRLRTKRFRGRVSVPVFFESGRVIEDSRAIAEYADSVMGQGTLFPSAKEGEIERILGIAERILELGRARVIEAVAADRDAQAEALPPFIPSAMRTALTPIAVFGTYFLAKKYKTEPRLQGHEERSRALNALEMEVLGKATNGFLFGAFSYADIVAATCLQFISPVDDRFIRLGPATRRAWTEPELATRHSSLLGWRDALYREMRSVS